VVAGPRNPRNRTPYTDDRDHSKGVIGDVLLLKRELKQRRDNLLRCIGVQGDLDPRSVDQGLRTWGFSTSELRSEGPAMLGAHG
jgi:hypothetical protein